MLLLLAAAFLAVGLDHRCGALVQRGVILGGTHREALPIEVPAKCHNEVSHLAGS